MDNNAHPQEAVEKAFITIFLSQRARGKSWPLCSGSGLRLDMHHVFAGQQE
jgi:hypothetical protein